MFSFSLLQHLYIQQIDPAVRQYYFDLRVAPGDTDNTRLGTIGQMPVGIAPITSSAGVDGRLSRFVAVVCVTSTSVFSFSCCSNAADEPGTDLRRSRRGLSAILLGGTKPAGAVYGVA
jgi:hypothetical protein